MGRGGRGKKFTPRGGSSRGASSGRGGRGSHRGGASGNDNPRPLQGNRQNAPNADSAGATDEDNRPFSLWDEARNTERHVGISFERLRDKKITFVSAGALEPSELLKPMAAEPTEQPDLENEHEDEPQIATITIEAGHEDDDSPMVPPEASTEEEEEEEALVREIDVGKIDLDLSIEVTQEVEISAPTGFVLDLVGDDSLTYDAGPAPRVPSPAPSSHSSASEKIVFVPRNRKGAPPPPENTSLPPKTSTQPTRTTSVDVRSTDYTIHGDKRTVHVVTTQERVITQSQPAPRSVSKAQKPPSVKPDDTPFFNGKRSTQGNKRRGRRRKNDDSDDEAVRDYMENIKAQMLAESSSDEKPIMKGPVNVRDLGGDEWIDDSSTDEDEAASDDEAIWRYKNGWGEDDLVDFDIISTDDEGCKGIVDMILRKRTRPSGVQYLIKWDGETVDDATWVLADKLDSEAEVKIKIFDDQEALRAAAQSSSEDSSDGEEEDEDEDEVEDDKNNNGMDVDDDLELAKLLQREEELLSLGIGGNDSDFSEIMDLEDDFFPMGKKKGASKKQQKRARRSGGLPDITPDRRTGFFPSASAMADAYDSFDIMDRERFSISMPKPNRKNKGKLAALDLSDEELADQLKTSWEADRQKKKMRKVQRQEARERGELGAKFNKTGKPNLSAKYDEGMTLNEVFTEIRQFMMRDHNSLALPPMDKAARKVIHNLAGKLLLKSKSVGAGKSRFTTLYKTQRSQIFEGDDEGLDSIMRHRTFLKRMDVGRARGGFGSGGRGGSSVGGAKRRDGEIVGHDAPELGADNKGRQMLEKMGYKSGMSLGAENNKGIVVPVLAIVKVSKAGLG